MILILQQPLKTMYEIPSITASKLQFASIYLELIREKRAFHLVYAN